MNRGECAVAFKEWAAVCEAIAAGRQTIILRKGGIHEGRDGFRVQHEQFWLYPTNFHEHREGLSEGAEQFTARAALARLAAGTIPIRLFAEVHAVHQLTSEHAALRLASQHIWSEVTVRQRFAYRRPGLFLLIVRVFALPKSIVIEESEAMAGCKSWVILPQAIVTDGLTPVLSDAEFATQSSAIESLLA